MGTRVLVLLSLFSLATVWSAAIHKNGRDVLLEVPLTDGHNDLAANLRYLIDNQLAKFNFSANLTTDPMWGHLYTDLPRLRAGRVGAQFWVAFVSCNSQYKDAVEQTLEQIDVLKRLIKQYPENMQYATSAQDILDAFKNGKIASLLAVEGGHSIDSRLAVLRQMYELGVRYLTLTHSCSTTWADASPVDDPNTGVPVEHDGLTEFGKVVVQELNRLGMMVDLSHVSYKTMIDAINASVAPVIFSHSSAYAICNHHRNVHDDVLKMMPENGGIVMVNFYSQYVNCRDSSRGTLEDVVAHINHIRTVAGIDHVGIGSDYDGVNSVPEGLEDVSKYPALFDRLANSLPGEPLWTANDLKKLAGLNLIRVFQNVEKVRDELAALSPHEDLMSQADIGNHTGCMTDFLS